MVIKRMKASQLSTLSKTSYHHSDFLWYMCSVIVVVVFLTQLLKIRVTKWKNRDQTQIHLSTELEGGTLKCFWLHGPQKSYSPWLKVQKTQEDLEARMMDTHWFLYAASLGIWRHLTWKLWANKWRNTFLAWLTPKWMPLKLTCC